MRIITFFYGIISYAIGVAALLYAICFVGDLWVPKTLDSSPISSLPMAALADLLLLGLFALQHSGMARPGFKKLWTRIVPKPVERSTYVLATGLVLVLLCWQWQPIPGTVWEVQGDAGRWLLQGLFWLGWAVLFSSTFMINHFDLFGLRQVYLRLKDEPYTAVPFMQVALYRFVRHPIMLGLLIGFWATPLMSLGHLLFATTTTGYIFIGILLEERDLHRSLGQTYDRYRRETSMIIPLPPRRAP